MDVGKLRERGAIAAVQHIDRAAGGDPGRRHQGAVAHDRQHDIAQFSRHVVVAAISQLGADLGARNRSGRQLEVPAGVGASGAPAQRECDRPIRPGVC